MKHKIILIGNGIDFQTRIDLIKREIHKNTIEIVGCIVLDNVNIDYQNIFKSFNELENVNFDYFILLTENKTLYKAIPEEYQFNQNIIPIHALRVENFDFNKYSQLLKNIPSIISKHYWGGFFYHKLGLRFNSPFINLFLSDRDFNKLSKNFYYYMNHELEFVKMGNDPQFKNDYPIGRLDDILIHFKNYSSFEEAKTKWDERKKRINYDNLIFETMTNNLKIAQEFDSLDISKKICFAPDSLDSPYIIDYTYLTKHRFELFVYQTATNVFPFFDLIEFLLNFNPETWFLKVCRNNYLNYLNYKKTDYFDIEIRRFRDEDDSVKWELDDKLKAYEFVGNYGVCHPKVIGQITDIDELRTLKDNGELPDNFVLKISNRSTGKGVFLLRKIKDELYFDYSSSKMYTLDDIIKSEKNIDSSRGRVLRETYYFIEELIDNFIEDFKIPYDYKVYCINGIPKIIQQFNKNRGGHDSALFDGNFVPLKEGRDWFIKSVRGRVGVPVIPPSAFEIIRQSAIIAKEADKKQVRIDWFDDGRKPVFGEFTFCSGTTYTATFTLPKNIWDNITNTYNNEDYTDYPQKGYLVDGKKLHENLDTKLDFNTDLYKELLKNCAIGNVTSMHEMVLYFEKLAQNEKDSIKKAMYQHLSICWKEILFMYNDSTAERLCRQIDRNYGFIISKTPYFKKRVDEANNALEKAGFKSDWFKVRHAQFNLDYKLNEENRQDFIKCINFYANKGLPHAKSIQHKYAN